MWKPKCKCVGLHNFVCYNLRSQFARKKSWIGPIALAFVHWMNIYVVYAFATLFDRIGMLFTLPWFSLFWLYEYIEIRKKKNQHMNVCAWIIFMYEWMYRRVTRQKSTLHFETKERAVSFHPCFLSILLLMYSHTAKHAHSHTHTHLNVYKYIYFKFYCLYGICSLALS